MSAREPLYETPWTVSDVDDCHFYHWMDIPGHGQVEADWDLRGGEADYLGGVALEGRRVLEIGPASGFMTFFMESRGAEVVAVELAPDADWDIVPQASVDLELRRREHSQVMQAVRRGFWFAHARNASSARVHYGTAYDIPAELGRFDVALMGSVCLHLREPLRAVEACARLSDRLVIADRHWPELGDQPVARLAPSAESGEWGTWWDMTPQFLVRFLGVLGYGQTSISFHEQRYTYPGGVVLIPMFTVVATRDGTDA